MQNVLAEGRWNIHGSDLLANKAEHLWGFALVETWHFFELQPERLDYDVTCCAFASTCEENTLRRANIFDGAALVRKSPLNGALKLKLS